MRRFFLLALLAMSVCLLGTPLFAQEIPADISIDTIPLNPTPGQTVLLRAGSFGVDLTQATLTWTYNGRTVSNGVGNTSVSVVAPAAGSSSTVTVQVTGIGLQSGTASIVLHPASLDLLWEAVDAYAPPFYKGKALAPVGGIVHVSAIPAASAPKGISFAWSRNGSALPDASGYGKSSIYFKQSALNATESVSVTASAGSYGGTGDIHLSPTDPMVITYQNKEGYIDYANGYANSFTLNNPGVVLHFEPYYFSIPRDIQSDLQIDTTIDGAAVSPTRKNEIGISHPAQSGKSTIQLALSTVAYSLQSLQKTFMLLFN